MTPNSTKALTALIAIAVISAVSYYWYDLTHRAANSTVLVTEKNTKEPLVDSTAGNTANLLTHGVKIDDDSSKVKARNLYIDAGLSPAARLLGLVALSDGGDASAKHLAFQIAMDCDLWVRAANNPSTVSNSRPDVQGYVKDALARISNGCSNVMNLSQYDNLVKPNESTGEPNPRDFYDDDVKQKIRRSFADNGEEKALSVALTYLRDRPDLITQQVILDSFRDLGIDDAFVMSTLPDNLGAPLHRSDLLPYALSLTQCDFGLPCGPSSNIVLSYCILENACLPGANLQQLYAEKILSGTDMGYVLILVNALHRIPMIQP